jgi:hypothetical protein
VKYFSVEVRSAIPMDSVEVAATQKEPTSRADHFAA